MWSFFLIIIIYSVLKSEKVPVLTQICFSKLEPFLSAITPPTPTERPCAPINSVTVLSSFLKSTLCTAAPSCCHARREEASAGS